jgi:drug/metabolite transporter (DMT)-like permease
MRTFLQVLVGLILGVAGTVVAIYLGLLLNGPPDLRTGAMVLALIAAGQVISFLSFRHHITLQVLFGLGLCIAIAVAWVYSPLPLFWEIADQPLVYPITWRSAVAFLILMVVTQGISFLAFRQIRRYRSRVHC